MKTGLVVILCTLLCLVAFSYGAPVIDLSFFCDDDDCCLLRQIPDEALGIEFLQFDPLCLTEAAGIQCLEDTGCAYCIDPAGVQALTDPSNSSVCRRFRTSGPCVTQCCSLIQNANPFTGNGYLQLNDDCALNIGNVVDLLFNLELPCVGATSCSLCFVPVVGGINIGNKPVCNFSVEDVIGIPVEVDGTKATATGSAGTIVVATATGAAAATGTATVTGAAAAAGTATATEAATGAAEETEAGDGATVVIGTGGAAVEGGIEGEVGTAIGTATGAAGDRAAAGLEVGTATGTATGAAGDGAAAGLKVGTEAALR